jgi:hypothetical protein
MPAPLHPDTLDPDEGGPSGALAYTQTLARRVHALCAELYPGLTLGLCDHLITEALYQIARDIHRGHLVAVEYLGTFDGAWPGSAGAWQPDRALFRANRPA